MWRALKRQNLHLIFDNFVLNELFGPNKQIFFTDKLFGEILERVIDG